MHQVAVLLLLQAFAVHLLLALHLRPLFQFGLVARGILHPHFGPRERYGLLWKDSLGRRLHHGLYPRWAAAKGAGGAVPVGRLLGANEIVVGALARGIAGPPGLAGGQRKPVALRRHAAVVLKTVWAFKPDQGRRVAGALVHWSGHPGPLRANLRPAAVVGGRKAPGRVVYPGPTPGGNPAPLAVLVGCPLAHGDPGKPHRAVFAVGAPVAIAVELLVADDIARHVTGAWGPVFGLVAGE